jgi:CubicO group peptidase (beta-lactamase class C family)
MTSRQARALARRVGLAAAITVAVAVTVTLRVPAVRGAPSPLHPLPPQAQDVPWPTTEWPTGPVPAGVSGSDLERQLAVVAAPQPLLGQTRAVLVVQRGRLVVERYMPGFGPDTPLISWSVAKSITQALVGIAVREGKVDIDQPMGNPRWPSGDRRAAIPWRHWLNMTDGQDYHEIGVTWPTYNDAARMLFGRGRLDVAAYSASLPLVHEPGALWNYNSAGINLIADALGRVFAPGAAAAERRDRMAAVMRRELFEPLGMTSVQAEFDAAGTFMGSAMVYATARDYARFGLLYLRDGMWEGRRVLPAGWVDFARTRTSAEKGQSYGAGWWVTPPDLVPGADKRSATPMMPRIPPDAFRAQGHEGQLIVVVPSRDLVVVRLGLLSNLTTSWTALGAWVQQLVALFPVVPAAVHASP